jgi:hypothetical protein
LACLLHSLQSPSDEFQCEKPIDMKQSNSSSIIIPVALRRLSLFLVSRRVGGESSVSSVLVVTNRPGIAPKPYGTPNQSNYNLHKIHQLFLPDA